MTTETAQVKIFNKVTVGQEQTDMEASFFDLVAELHHRIVQENSHEIENLQRSPLLTVEVEGFQYALMCVGQSSAKNTSSSPLSPRELEIARLISKGLPNKAIASILDISPWTVATHLRRVYIKLEVNSRAEMVAKLMKAGVIGTQRAHL